MVFLWLSYGFPSTYWETPQSTWHLLRPGLVRFTDLSMQRVLFQVRLNLKDALRLRGPQSLSKHYIGGVPYPKRMVYNGKSMKSIEIPSRSG